MVFIIVLGIIGVVIGIGMVFGDRPYRGFFLDEFFMAGLMALLLGALGAFFGFGAAYGLGALTGPDYQKNTYDLVTVDDNSGVSGRFYLFGSGSIGTSSYFNFYVKNGEQYVLRTAPASLAQIYYTDDTPTVTFSQDPGGVSWFTIRDPKTESIVFKVPEGSITNDYTLGDLND